MAYEEIKQFSRTVGRQLAQQYYRFVVGDSVLSPDRLRTFNLRLYRTVINFYWRFPDLFERILDEQVSYSTVYCPFHDDTSHPSGKLYQDDDGDRLYCFVEKRQYRPYDLIEKYRVSEKRTYFDGALQGIRPEALQKHIRHLMKAEENHNIYREIIKPEEIKRYQRNEIGFEKFRLLLNAAIMKD